MNPFSNFSILFRLFFLAIAVLSTSATVAAHAGDPIEIQGTTVSIVPIAGMRSAKHFTGIVHEQLGASVLIVEFPPVAYEQMSALFHDLDTAKQGFARQLIKIETLETLGTDAGHVPLASGTQIIGGSTFDKWIALYRGEKVVLVTIQAPQASKLGVDAVKSMLASISLGDAPTVWEKLETLPFRIEPQEPFRVVDTIGGLSVLLTAGPLDTDPKETQANIIVSFQALAAIDLSDLEVASERMLKAMHGFSSAEILARDQQPFAGLMGFVLRGTRKTNAGGEKAFVHYLGVGPNKQYVRMIAQYDRNESAQIDAAIEKMAASVMVKEPKLK